MGTMGIYKPLYVWCSPASIPQIVAHIQDYLVKNPIVSTETVAEIVVQSLQEHPELINGSVIPITEDSAQTIKEYIDALPLLDGYTKAETDALLLLKQNLLTWDQTPTAGSSNPVTSEGIKAAISATAAALADLISTKADIASVYTKSVMDTLLIQKADVATTYSKNAVDALLDTKVDINETYTKADIDLMKQVDKANTAIVSSTDGTAPLNIAAGQYVYLNDILYMATQAIPEDDPLVPGTNIVLTPKGVANNIGDGLQNLARTVGEQSDQIANVVISNEYSSILDAVNAYKSVKAFPFTIQKNGNSVFTDLPTEMSNTDEWNLLCYGSQSRTTLILSRYTQADATYIRTMFNGSYMMSNWLGFANSNQIFVNPEQLINNNVSCSGLIIRIGNITIIHFDILAVALSLNTDVTVGTLPEKYRPQITFNQILTANGREIRLRIVPNGTITMMYKGGDPLPSDGMPGIAYSVVLIN